MKALALLGVGRIALDLPSLAAFYRDALEFSVEEAAPDTLLASLLGVQRVHAAWLRRGAQSLHLAQTWPRGAPYPQSAASNDALFQHVALVTDDIASAYARLCRHPHTPISRGGPSLLPGGIVAYKFRDPEMHPLELIQFPQPPKATRGGIDHTAIAVADTQASIDFYRSLGLRVGAPQTNTGPAQDALDGLDHVAVEVVPLLPEAPAPHIELLGYRSPEGQKTLHASRSDLAATRTLLHTDAAPVLLRDPDGHLVQL